MNWENTEFLAVQGDITKNHGVQAIVNAANTSLLGGGGVDGAIHRAAGPELLEECRGLHGCETGDAKITKAYRLPCDYVIHTELLASCYYTSLQLCMEHGIRSVAFPSISTGVYHFPLQEAAEIAVWTAREFVTQNPEALDQIMWVLFDSGTFEVYRAEIERACSAEV